MERKNKSLDRIRVLEEVLFPNCIPDFRGNDISMLVQLGKQLFVTKKKKNLFVIVCASKNEIIELELCALQKMKNFFVVVCASLLWLF